MQEHREKDTGYVDFINNPRCSVYVNEKDATLTVSKGSSHVEISLTPDQFHDIIKQKEAGATEIERKFIVDWRQVESQLDMFKADIRNIDQHYLFLGEQKEVRIRAKQGQADTQYEFTIKTGAGEVRGEYNIALFPDQYNKLATLIEKSLIKTRHIVGKQEFDRYGGTLTGLDISEVEFPDTDTSSTYQIPSYVVREVTHDPRFKNAALAGQSLHEIFRSEELAMILGKPFVKPSIAIPEIISRAQQIQKQLQKPVVIRIAGGSASGKTSAVADKIQQGLTGSILISLDDYNKGGSFVQTEKSKGRTMSFDEPGYVDMDLAHTNIQELQQGHSIEKPTFDFKAGEPGEKEQCDSAPYIIVEGLFALDDRLDVGNSIDVFVDASTHGRAMRRLLRDVQRTSMTPHQILEYFFRVVEPMHQQHVQSTISNADIIIDNDYDAPIESSRAPNREKQTKIKVSADTPIINLLEQQGATLIGHTQQEDHYFTLPDDGNEEIVRIRKQGAHHQFSYKGPLLPDGSKHIYDCKTDPVLLELLEKSYTQQPLIIRKDRAIYQLDGKLLSVDSSIQLGNQILDEILIEVRDADSDMQENILKLLENGDIEHKVFAQMSYVKYAKKIMNI